MYWRRTCAATYWREFAFDNEQVLHLRELLINIQALPIV